MRHLIILVALLNPLTGFCKGSPVREVARLEQDILNNKLPDRATYALEILLGRAAKELKARGHKVEADRLLAEWKVKHRRIFYTYALATMRDIGDHQALNQWLADKYEMLEIILGVDICKSLHLSDIKTFLYTPPIVFRPSTFPMDNVQGERIDEYRRHFNEGAVYYGLVPVVSYWVIWGACTVGTSGMGAVAMLCGIAGSVGERLLATFVGPKLSDWVYNKATGGLMSSPNDWDYWEGE
jgi:hypothetical protein